MVVEGYSEYFGDLTQFISAKNLQRIRDKVSNGIKKRDSNMDKQIRKIEKINAKEGKSLKKLEKMDKINDRKEEKNEKLAKKAKMKMKGKC
jgi:hypothetical protein